MKHVVLAWCVKGIEIFVLLMGLIFYGWMVPAIVDDMGQSLPEFQYLVTPSVILISLSGIPVLAALALLWRICSNVAKEKSFCMANSKYLAAIGACALFDAVYCFAFAAYLFSAGAQNPGTALIFLGVILSGLAIAAIAFLLSHLVYRAAQMADEIRQTV